MEGELGCVVDHEWLEGGVCQDLGIKRWRQMMIYFGGSHVLLAMLLVAVGGSDEQGDCRGLQEANELTVKITMWSLEDSYLNFLYFRYFKVDQITFPLFL